MQREHSRMQPASELWSVWPKFPAEAVVNHEKIFQEHQEVSSVYHVRECALGGRAEQNMTSKSSDHALSQVVTRHAKTYCELFASMRVV